jgi:hypothetical protein
MHIMARNRTLVCLVIDFERRIAYNVWRVKSGVALRIAAFCAKNFSNWDFLELSVSYEF